MAAFYILLGVMCGVVGIFIFGYYASKKDNKKFDATETMNKTVTESSGPIWPEPGYMSEPIWQSTRIETTFVNAGKGSEKKSDKNAKEKPLEDQLKEALENEWYEKAAEIRDKINNAKTK